MPGLSVDPGRGSNRLPGLRHQTFTKHEVVKVSVMKRRLSVSAGLLIGALTLPGAAAAKAAGIGVQLGVLGHNIPRAIANGHHLHVQATRERPQTNPNVRSIHPNTTDESTAIKSRK